MFVKFRCNLHNIYEFASNGSEKYKSSYFGENNRIIMQNVYMSAYFVDIS